MATVRPLAEISSELQAWFSGQQKSQAEIALLTGVRQSTVSRQVSGHEARYVSRGLRRLCELAGINLHIQEANAARALTAAVDRLWDRTPEHASAIVALLDAARVVGRS